MRNESQIFKWDNDSAFNALLKNSDRLREKLDNTDVTSQKQMDSAKITFLEFLSRKKIRIRRDTTVHRVNISINHVSTKKEYKGYERSKRLYCCLVDYQKGVRFYRSSMFMV